MQRLPCPVAPKPPPPFAPSLPRSSALAVSTRTCSSVLARGCYRVYPRTRTHVRRGVHVCTCTRVQVYRHTGWQFPHETDRRPQYWFLCDRPTSPWRQLCARYAGGFLFEGVPDPKLTRNIVYRSGDAPVSPHPAV